MIARRQASLTDKYREVLYREMMRRRESCSLANNDANEQTPSRMHCVESRISAGPPCRACHEGVRDLPRPVCTSTCEIGRDPEVNCTQGSPCGASAFRQTHLYPHLFRKRLVITQPSLVNSLPGSRAAPGATHDSWPQPGFTWVLIERRIERFRLTASRRRRRNRATTPAACR